MKIWHNSTLEVFIIPPGDFFTLARKANEVELEKDRSFGYSLTYGIIKKFNKDNVTCKESLNFVEDKCKLNQVKYKTHNFSFVILPYRYLKGFWKLTTVSLHGWTILTCKLLSSPSPSPKSPVKTCPQTDPKWWPSLKNPKPLDWGWHNNHMDHHHYSTTPPASFNHEGVLQQ